MDRKTEQKPTPVFAEPTMVFVDFSNPFLRRYLESTFVSEHEERMADILEQLPGWVETFGEAEKERGEPRPLAVVLDIDEVLLSNIHMNSHGDFHAADYFTRGDNDAPWPRDEKRLNPLLPGARALLKMILALDVEVFFLTGRSESIRDETIENFQFVGLVEDTPDENWRPVEPPLFSAEDFSLRLIMRPVAVADPVAAADPVSVAASVATTAAAANPTETVAAYKTARRRKIESTHRIIANVGDQVSDLGLYGDIQVHMPHPFYWTE